MNQNAFMAASLLLMLSIVVLTPFFFTPESPVIFYENPTLVVDYLNSSKEFRVYVYCTATNVRYQSISINLTNLTTHESVSKVFNYSCAAFINTTWISFKLNVTVVLDIDSIYDGEIIISLTSADPGIITIERTKDGGIQNIGEGDLPFPIPMERRW
ncbi:MAG: hypothetical protein QXJ27_01870 [Thermoplasmata archaeon]